MSLLRYPSNHSCPRVCCPTNAECSYGIGASDRGGGFCRGNSDRGIYVRKELRTVPEWMRVRVCIHSIRFRRHNQRVFCVCFSARLLSRYIKRSIIIRCFTPLSRMIGKLFIVGVLSEWNKPNRYIDVHCVSVYETVGFIPSSPII